MKSRLFSLAIIIILLSSISSKSQNTSEEGLPNGFLVKFKPEMTVNDIKAKASFLNTNKLNLAEYFEHLDIWFILVQHLRCGMKHRSSAPHYHSSIETGITPSIPA